MANVFEAQDYKAFLREWLADRPKGGRGESRRLAEKLGVSTTLVSQVVSGDKHFTMEAASDLCDHIGLTEKESDHFLLLVDLARAGNRSLRARLEKKVARSRESARKLVERVEHDRNMTDAQAATYYSHWIYTGIRNYVAVKADATAEEIARKMNVPTSLVNRVMGFLLDSGVLVMKDGKYDQGVKRTWLGADSPLVIKHHQNWRLQALNKMPYSDPGDLFLTMPMSCSREVAEKIREDLGNYFQKMGEMVGPSASETVRCFNLDWFEY